MNAQVKTLDRLFPLAGASHADAESYAILIPMRYAECVARLRDGTTARFRQPQALLGWSGPAERRRFLLHNGGKGMEIRINTARRRQVRRIREMRDLAVVGRESQARRASRADANARKFIGRDGDLLYVRLQTVNGAQHEQTATDRTARIGLERESALEGCHP